MEESFARRISIQDFEKKWQAWLEDPIHQRRVSALAASQRATDDGVVEKAGRRLPSFGSFSTGREFKTKMPFPASSSSQSSGQ